MMIINNTYKIHFKTEKTASITAVIYLKRKHD